MGTPPTWKLIQSTSMVIVRVQYGWLVERWKQANIIILSLMLRLGIVTQPDQIGGHS